jgi:vacuolar-type H+-ATPase subunit D/Vma8
LDLLREKLKAAEDGLAEIKKERDGIMDAIIAGSGVAENFREYLECKEKIKQAEQKAIEALEAWGDAAARKFDLKD